MPLEFAELGVRFQYPDNWTLSKDAALADCRNVTVSSPGGAFWTLSIHPRLTDPDQLVEAAVEVMREEYKDLEDEVVREEVDGFQLVGREINFYCLDLTNTAWIHSLQTDGATYTIFCQAEDREFEKIRDVFRAMRASFLGNLKG